MSITVPEHKTTRRGMAYREYPADPDGSAPLTWLGGSGGVRGVSWFEIQWQDRLLEDGRVGMQPEDMLEVVAERLRGLNAALPCRETSLAITHVEDAILWLNERRRDRTRRGVEGTHEK